MIDLSELSKALAARKAGDEIFENEQSHLARQTESLSEIHYCVKTIMDFLQVNTLPQQEDQPSIVTLYKTGVGPEYIVESSQRSYIFVQNLVSVPILISSPLGPAVTVTLPGVFSASSPYSLWIPFDLVDGTKILLDSSASVSSQNIWVKRSLVK